MREILFRGKHVFDGKWGYGGYAESKSGRVCLAGISKLGMVDGYEVDPETVGQFTGLIAYWDDEAAAVWEHDLLEVEYGKRDVIAEVRYENGMFILVSNEFADGYIPLFNVVVLEDDCWVDGKVIGNIFDNPDLMEAGDLID